MGPSDEFFHVSADSTYQRDLADAKLANDMFWSDIVIPENLLNINLEEAYVMIIPKILRQSYFQLFLYPTGYELWIEYYKIFQKLASANAIKKEIIFHYSKMLLASPPICKNQLEEENAKKAQAFLKEVVETLAKEENKTL